MFKTILNSLASSGSSSGIPPQGGAENGSKGATPAQLRADIYTGIDSLSLWISSGKAENGIDYRSILALVDKHFPGTQINRCTDEVPVLVGGLTNMILEYSKTEGLPAAMALRTFMDKLISALNALDGSEDKQKKTSVGEGIARGFTQVADPALATREFTPRVQIVGSFKNLAAAIYGKGSAEARNADVVWASRFI
ncbi:hypothetical protein CPB86DRAFT_777859 [Serendipita vermifera]|nr:hypothetical protein CPB86DRAFT_777859 [Serendipita vermifera]